MPDYNNDQVWNQIQGAYNGWDKNQALHDFYDSRGGNFAKLDGPIGDQYRAQDPTYQAQRLLKFQQDANQPAIQSLQGQLPEIHQRYAQAGQQLSAQRQPLEDRYAALLESIKGNQQQATDSTTKAVNTGLGARGLLPSSQLGQTELGGALNPILSQFSGQLGQTNAAHETDIQNLNNMIANLAPQETSDTRAIQEAIAQLQAGNPAQAIQQALGFTGQQLQNSQFQSQLGLQQQQQQFNQRYITIPGYGIYDTQTKSLLGGMSQTGLGSSGNTVLGQY